MATLDYDYSFQNNTTANAVEVMGNFNKAKSFAETRVVQTDGSVKADTAAIADSAITTAKIADNAVTNSKLADGAVNTAEIVDDAITAAKVKDNETLPVSISGNAASASSVAWGSISGVPAIGNVFNDSGTYSINVTGSAGSAGYATSAGSANTANSATSAGTAAQLSSGGLSLFQSASWWYTPNEFDFGGLIFYLNPGPSSATEGIVRIASGELKKNSASGVSKRDHKEDIVPMENALEQLSLLQPRNFRFKEEILVPNEPYDVFNRRTQLQYGFVMEEVQDAVPDLVMHKSPDGIEHEAMYWKESGMIALAVAAIQELSAKVDALQAEVDSLKNG